LAELKIVLEVEKHHKIDLNEQSLWCTRS